MKSLLFKFNGWTIGFVLVSLLVVAGIAFAGLTTVNEGNLLITTTGTPNFISGTNGDLYVQDQLEVDGSVSVDGTLLRIDASTDKIGVKTSGPNEALTINGAVSLMEGPTINEEDDFAKFYAKEVSWTEMYVVDGNANHTLLSSHADPRDFDPDAEASFGDLSIPLPFSFKHSNAYLGKGAVVDLAAVVAEVERLSGRDFTVEYDLPPEELRDIANKLPEIEIPIEEAWESVEITVPATTTQYAYNLDTLEVTSYEAQDEKADPVGTGQFERRLKPGVRFDETTGTFHRLRTGEEITPDLVPRLPRWIVERLCQSE